MTESEHKGVADAYGVVLLNGALYQDGLIPNYMDARRIAESLGMPSEIVRYTIPLAIDGKFCEKCVALVVRKHKVHFQTDPVNHHLQSETTAV